MRGDTCAGLEIIMRLTITINMSLRVNGLLHELSRRHVENENAKRVPRGRPATRQGFLCKGPFQEEVDKKGKVVVVSLPRGVLCFGVQGPKHSSGRMHRPRTHSTVSRPRPREAGLIPFQVPTTLQPQPDRLTVPMAFSSTCARLACRRRGSLSVRGRVKSTKKPYGSNG